MDIGERRIPVYRLLEFKHILKQLLSFSAIVDRCNFTFKFGWGGKTYVNDHGMEEYKPDLRGVDLLDVYYLKLIDTVVLTEDQCKDYKIIAGLE